MLFSLLIATAAAAAPEAPATQAPVEAPAEVKAPELKSEADKPKAEPTCDVSNLCLTRADLTLLISARALAEEGLFPQAVVRYQKLLADHPDSPFAGAAAQELAIAKSGPMRTGPMAFNLSPAGRPSGTFTGILLGTVLTGMTTASFFALTDSLDGEPAIITTVLTGAAGAWGSGRLLRQHPQTLGTMDMALLGAVWLPTVGMSNIFANNADPRDATLMVVTGMALAGAGAGYAYGRAFDVHAGAATFAWSGAAIGGAEAGLLLVAMFPDGGNDAAFTAIVSLGSLAGLLGGTHWANQRKFSSGRGRIMTVSAWGAVGLSAAVLSLMDVDSTRLMTATMAAALPIGAWIGLMFTEGYEEPNSARAPATSQASLHWALDQTLQAAR